MSKEPKLCVLGVLGGKENFEAIALGIIAAFAWLRSRFIIIKWPKRMRN